MMSDKRDDTATHNESPPSARSERRQPLLQILKFPDESCGLL